jgi:hypothetical protein
MIVDQSTPVRHIMITIVSVLSALAMGAAGYGLLAHKSAMDGPATPRLVNLPLDSTYNGPTLSVGLSRPVAYRPSSLADIGQWTGRAVTFNVAVANNAAAEPFSVASLAVEATSGTTQDSQVTDVVRDIGSSTATVLPGRSLVWQIAFTVPADAPDITVTVTPVAGGTVAFSGAL